MILQYILKEILKKMKYHVYYREDTQEIRTLPINAPNCYYLGYFDKNQIYRLYDLLEKRMYSLKELEDEVRSWC